MSRRVCLLLSCWSVVAVSAAGAQEVISFSGLPAGHYAATDGDPNVLEVFGDSGSGPILIDAFNPRFGIGVNAAVVFDTALPTGNDLDLGSPNETCDPPGPGVGISGEVGMPFENCPPEALGVSLIVAENLVDANGDGLIDDPDDEGLSGIKESVHVNLDFSALGTVTLHSISILDTEEPGPIVQLFGGDGSLLASFQLAMTGNNGLGAALSLGPTAGVARMNIALQGSGALDNIAFEGVPGIDIRKQDEGPDKRALRVGSDVSFEIVVTNTGSTLLTDVTVSDRRLRACDRAIGELLPGESAAYECVVENVLRSFTNEACVHAQSIAGPVEDCDRSTVELIDVDIRKEAEGADVRTFPPGSDVSFEIVVTNSGPTGLSGVTVTDPQTPSCDRTVGPLRAGAVVKYTCVAPSVRESFVNEACVQAERRGTTIGDCDTSEVVVE